MKKCNFILLFLLCLFFCSCDATNKQNNTFDSSSNSFSDTSNSSSPSNDTRGNSSEISAPQIEKDIIGRVTEVEHGTALQILTGQARGTWTFAKEEPRNLQILEADYSGKNASIIINVETCDYIFKYSVAGKLRLHYEFITGEWNLRQVENINFKENPDGNAQCKEYFEKKNASNATPSPTRSASTPTPSISTPTPPRMTNSNMAMNSNVYSNTNNANSISSENIYAKVKLTDYKLLRNPNSTEILSDVEYGDRLLLLAPTKCRTCHKDGWYYVKHLRTGKEGWIYGDGIDVTNGI